MSDIKKTDNPYDKPKLPRRKSFHDLLALINALCFFAVCTIVLFAVVYLRLTLDAAEAGIVGAILGYWAGNVGTVNSYYYGSSSPSRNGADSDSKEKKDAH